MRRNRNRNKIFSPTLPTLYEDDLYEDENSRLMEVSFTRYPVPPTLSDNDLLSYIENVTSQTMSFDDDDKYDEYDISRLNNNFFDNEELNLEYADDNSYFIDENDNTTDFCDLCLYTRSNDEFVKCHTCKNKVCGVCYDRLRNGKCPYCRYPMLSHYYDSDSDSDSDSD
jgi:hypothetical protein